MSEEKSSSIGTPLSNVEIDITLVYSLLSDQHPDLMHLPIHLVDAGWDNVMFRLGDQLSVRLPRRKAAATLIENEQTWLPLLAEQLTIAVPTPYTNTAAVAESIANSSANAMRQRYGAIQCRSRQTLLAKELRVPIEISKGSSVLEVFDDVIFF